MQLVIAVCCFRRPEGVRRLSRSLGAVVVPVGIERPLDLLLLDNDPAGSLSPLDDGVMDLLSGHLRVSIEHVGLGDISAARNVALRRASGHDLLAFLDDDEWPDPDWLVQLFATMVRHDADVVVGPVVGSVHAGAPRWQRQLSAVAYGADGDLLCEGITGNVLMRTAAIRDVAIRFRSELGVSGGEDQVFFREAVAAGVQIRYSAYAMVYESVPPERLTVRYVLERALRTGNTLGLLDGHLMRSSGTVAARTAKAAMWAARGVLRIAASPVTVRFRRTGDDRWSAAVIGASEIARAAGMVLGLVGLQQQFYGSGRRISRWRGSAQHLVTTESVT